MRALGQQVIPAGDVCVFLVPRYRRTRAFITILELGRRHVEASCQHVPLDNMKLSLTGLFHFNTLTDPFIQPQVEQTNQCSD